MQQHRWHVVPTATSTGGQPTNVTAPTPTVTPTTTPATSHRHRNFGRFGIPGFQLPQDVTDLLNQVGQGSSTGNAHVQTYQVGNWTIQVVQF